LVLGQLKTALTLTTFAVGFLANAVALASW
jgi:hypothetical protein